MIAEMIPFSWQRWVFDETDFYSPFQRWVLKQKKKKKRVFEQIAPVLTGSIHTL